MVSSAPGINDPLADRLVDMHGLFAKRADRFFLRIRDDGRQQTPKNFQKIRTEVRGREQNGLADSIQFPPSARVQQLNETTLYDQPAHAVADQSRIDITVPERGAIYERTIKERNKFGAYFIETGKPFE